MIVGVLSDTHGKAKTAAAAVRLLADHGAEYFVHCGDVGGMAVLDALAGRHAMFVFGNNDWDQAALSRYAADLHIACGGEQGKLAFGTKLAVVTHGDNAALVQRLLREQQIDYLFVGHSHQMSDQRQGRVRIINPGALHRATPKTVAVLDTEADTVEFLVVPEP